MADEPKALWQKVWLQLTVLGAVVSGAFGAGMWTATNAAETKCNDRVCVEQRKTIASMSELAQCVADKLEAVKKQVDATALVAAYSVAGPFAKYHSAKERNTRGMGQRQTDEFRSARLELLAWLRANRNLITMETDGGAHVVWALGELEVPEELLRSL